jgi:hypothetical protein
VVRTYQHQPPFPHNKQVTCKKLKQEKNLGFVISFFTVVIMGFKPNDKRKVGLKGTRHGTLNFWKNFASTYF